MKVETLPPVSQLFPAAKSNLHSDSTGVKLFGNDAVTFDTERDKSGGDENPYQEFFRKKRKKKDKNDENPNKEGAHEE